MESARSHLVITVHGIRTFGQWQERLEALVRAREPSARVHHYKYGYFSCIAFMIPPLRWLVVRQFRRALVAACASGTWDRVDVVAHSFGTHIVAWALHGLPREKRPRIHTLILAGSVLKPSFPWQELTEQSVGRVVNDCGTKDGVLVLNQAVVLFTGMAGRVGFAGMNHDRFRNRFFAHGHSDYFLQRGAPSDEFMRTWWLPALCGDEPPSVPPDPRDASPLHGVAAFVFNNLEPIKVAAVVAPFVVLAIVYFGLYREADAQREEARRRLVALQVSHAQNLSDEGDLATAVIWSAEALRSVGTSDEHNERVRIGTTLRQHPRLARVLFLNEFGPFRAEFSSDGSLLAITGRSGARVLDVETGAVSATIVHGSGVTSLAFSRDGRRLATGSADRKVRVFDARSGAPLTPPLEHDAAVSLVRFRRDGERLLTVGRAGEDGSHRARVWDVASGAGIGAAMVHSREIGDAAFSPDGDRVATISDDETTRIWDAESGEPVAPAIASGKRTHWMGSRLRLDFSPDGSKLLTSDGSGVSVWDARSGAAKAGPWEIEPCFDARFLDDVAVLGVDAEGSTRVFVVGEREWRGSLWVHRGRHSRSIAVALPANEIRPRIAIGWTDGTARVFEATSERALTPPLRHTGAVTFTQLSPNGRYLVTIDVTDVVRVFDLSVSPALVLDHSDAFEAPFVWEACFDSSGERVLSVARDFHSAHLWDARTGEHRLAFPHDAAVEGARFAPGGERVLTFGQDRTARLWNSRTGERVSPALEHESPVLVASFNSDGALVVTGCEDGTAHVWRVSDGSKVAEIEHAGPVVTVSFTPDGSCFLVAGGVSARLYDVATGERVTAGERQDESGVSAAALSPDGRTIATGGADGVVRIWDARTGAPITSELVHSSGPKYANFSQKVNHVAFSADSKLLATTSSDETTRLWDATTGAPVASPIGGTGSHLAFSPGSRWIATAAMSGLVRLWDVRTGAAVSPPWMHESSATHVAFDASGSRLLSAGLDGTVRIVSLLLDERPPDVIRRWAEVLACQRVDEMGGLVELTVDELRERWDALMAPSSR